MFNSLYRSQIQIYIRIYLVGVHLQIIYRYAGRHATNANFGRFEQIQTLNARLMEKMHYGLTLSDFRPGDFFFIGAHNLGSCSSSEGCFVVIIQEVWNHEDYLLPIFNNDISVVRWIYLSVLKIVHQCNRELRRYTEGRLWYLEIF